MVDLALSRWRGVEWAKNQRGSIRNARADRKESQSAIIWDGSSATSNSPTATGLKKLGAIGKVGFGGLGKLLSGFGRLLPVIGQISFAFMGLSAIAKMFGLDLGKVVGDVFKDIGMAMGWVDTPAVKAAKALDKLTDAAYEAAAAQGGFTPETAKKMMADMRNAMAKQQAAGALVGDKAAEKAIKEGKDPRAVLLERKIRSCGHAGCIAYGKRTDGFRHLRSGK